MALESTNHLFAKGLRQIRGIHLHTVHISPIFRTGLRPALNRSLICMLLSINSLRQSGAMDVVLRDKCAASMPLESPSARSLLLADDSNAAKSVSPLAHGKGTPS